MKDKLLLFSSAPTLLSNTFKCSADKSKSPQRLDAQGLHPGSAFQEKRPRLPALSAQGFNPAAATAQKGRGARLFFVIATFTLLFCASCSKAYEFHGTVIDPAKPAADITGTNLDGKPFKLKDLGGKIVVAFFGYTNCPDVCPLTLANMNSAYEKLGDKAKDVAFVFVSTDPTRDTPKRLADYVPVFNKTFYGVNVPSAALDNVKRGYGVFSDKNKEVQSSDANTYFVDHSGYIYIIDQQGQWRLTYAYDIPVEELVADLEHLLAGEPS